MLLSTKQTIEDHIVEILSKAPHTQGPELVAAIKLIRPGTTKQAVYAALRPLLESEVVAKVGPNYFISRIWVNEVNKLFQTSQEQEIQKDAIFELSDGESISYTFPSLLSCDTYWAHIYNVLIDWTPAHRPIFIWNPHDLFTIARKTLEEDIFNSFKRNNKRAFFTTRNTSPLDRAFQKEWTTNHVSINMDNNIDFPDSYHINVFDDFIIEVFLAVEFTERLENLYQKHQKATPAAIYDFEELINSKYAMRMKITRKHTKAIQLRKKMAKGFYVPLELKID